MDDNTFLTQTEAAELLRLSARTLERHRVAGTGPRFVKAGRRVLYRLSDIHAWTAERTFSSTSEADENPISGLVGLGAMDDPERRRDFIS